MSEEDKNEIVGRLMREYSESRKQAAFAREKLRAISAQLELTAQSLREAAEELRAKEPSFLALNLPASIDNSAISQALDEYQSASYQMRTAAGKLSELGISVKLL